MFKFDARAFTRSIERAVSEVRRLAWAARNGRLTDDERLTIALATAHARSGRFDLVEEDFAWLGARL